MCWVVGHLVDQPLEDAGEQEGAGEGGADQHLGALGAGAGAAGGRARRGGAGARRRPRRAGRCRCRRRARSTRAPDARRRRRGARSRGLAALALGLVGLRARPLGLGAAACLGRSRALRSLRESFSSRSAASSTASCALAVSSSARRASVSASSLAQLGARGPRRRVALGGLPRPARLRPRESPRRRACAARGRRSLGRIFPEGAARKSRARAGWSRSRPARRAPASRPDHSEALDHLVVGHGRRSLADVAMRLEAVADRPDDVVAWPARSRRRPRSSSPKIQPVSTCSIAP